MNLFPRKGVQEFRSSGVKEFRSSGVQEFRSSGDQEFRISDMNSTLLNSRHPYISRIDSSG
jgi:hypothetical protein